MKKDNETEALKKRKSELYQKIGQLKYEVNRPNENLRSSARFPFGPSQSVGTEKQNAVP